MARTKHGLPGIYNASAITLSDQEGAAIALDVNGKPINSPQSFTTPLGDSLIDDTNDALKVTLVTAMSNLIDTITAYDTTDSIMSGTTALTPKYAIIQESSSGNNAVVAAVTAKKIRVLAYNFIAAGTVNAKFQSDGATTPVDLTGLKYCVANTGICAPYNPKGWFESASGKSLDLNLSAAVAVGGELLYIEV